MSAESHESALLRPDDPLARQLRDVAGLLDSTSTSFDGSAIRSASEPALSVTPPSAGPNSRLPGRRMVLSAAVCFAFGLGGLGLIQVTRNEEPVQPVSAVESVVDTSLAPLSEEETAAPITTTNEPAEGNPSGQDVMPDTTGADEVGPVEARLLPPADTGYELLEAVQLLHSDAEVGPLPPFPKLPALSALYTDYEGKNSLRLHLATYGEPAEADLAMAYVEENSHTETDAIDEDGVTGVWIGDEVAFAPNVGSAEDQSTIGTAEIRLDGTRILTVVGIDLSRDLALTLALQLIAADGDEVFPPAPEGYTGPTVRSGPAFPTFRHDTDQLVLTLSDRATGELVEIMVQAADPEASAGEADETAEVIGTTGLGWYDDGLWGTSHLTWVRPDVNVELISPTGNLSLEQLVDLAESLEWTDEEQWVERTAGAMLAQVPLHP